jgi:hypothetical protein
MDMAVIDINSAISAMNSRNGKGNLAAVASEVVVSGEVKRVQSHKGYRTVGSIEAARQCALN